MKIISKLSAVLEEPDFSGELRENCLVCGYSESLVIRLKHSRIVSIHCFACGDWNAVRAVLSTATSKEWVQLTKPEPLSPEEAEAKTAKARKLWDSSLPIAGTPVERYLAGRRLEYLLASTALRFHPAASHPHNICLPALIAKITNVDGKLIGVQRTYLAPDGRSKAAVNPQRADLGLVGGGTVRLFDFNPAKPLVVIGEGTETTASAARMYGGVPWAALSTGNMESLQLPSEIQEVVIAADPDPPGIRAARTASRRWKQEGRTVRMFRPPGNGDFNDVLCAKGQEMTHG